MEETRVSIYRRIVSSTAIFGSAQLANLVVNAIRGRLVAGILHSSGMGVMSLLTNAGNTIQQIALMGINISAVRNISQVNEQGDTHVIDFTIRLVRAMMILASILGFVLTIVLSPLMSKFSFGTGDYVFFFVLLSISVLFNVLGTGEMAIMQGLRRNKLLAFCSTVPPLCGLLISIPIYYVWGIQGIVPAMILGSAIYYIVIRRLSYKYQHKQEQHEHLSLRLIWNKGYDIIQFGMVMTIGTVVGTITTYALSAFISNEGSVSDVGFYQAANAITMQYIGIIFTAMATDYYPHLASIIKTELENAFRFVNQQAEIVLLITTPIALLIILTAPLLINLLLGSDFIVIEKMVRYIGLAAVFRAFCFSMDYIAYAKGDKQYIFWVETVWCNIKTFSIMAGFYYFMGLDGLGYGALCNAALEVVLSILFTRWRYGFVLSWNTFRLLLMVLPMVIGCFFCSFLTSIWLSYSLMISTTLLCSIYCIIQIDRRMDLRSLLIYWKNHRKSLRDSNKSQS